MASMFVPHDSRYAFRRNEILAELKSMDDQDHHYRADRLLVELLLLATGEQEIADAYNDIPKWFD